VSDSRNTVHSNYFIAKPRFWRAWLSLCEQMFAIAESPTDPLGRSLCSPTRYRGRSDAQLKVFIVERLATWILLHDRSFVTLVRHPFAARSRTYKLPSALVCDALKMAYASSCRTQYKEVFLLVQSVHKYLNLQIRLLRLLGFGRVRTYLQDIKSPASQDPQ
jgi:hypothetical protein